MGRTSDTRDEPASSRSHEASGSETNRRITSIAAAAALCAALITAAVYVVSSPSPSAMVVVILNENSVGWPFYAAAQEKAQVEFEDDATVDLIRNQVTDPTAALELSVAQPGDLSMMEVTASATNDAAAIEFAEIAATTLVANSLAEQRRFHEDSLERLVERRVTLMEAIDMAAVSLDTAESESVSITAAGRLEQLVAELSSVETEIANTTDLLAMVEPEYRILGSAELENRNRQTVVAALSAGVAAGLLSILLLSCLPFRPQQSAP